MSRRILVYCLCLLICLSATVSAEVRQITITGDYVSQAAETIAPLAVIPADVMIDGSFSATTLLGDGAGITNINATNVTGNMNLGGTLSATGVTSTGSVGIGTGTPETGNDYGPMLHVKGATASDSNHWSGRIIASGPLRAVVMGEWNGVAHLAGHYSSLNAWTDLALNAAGGNVGIGTSTPSQKLSVTGTIESTAGGFKFPNGTIQTSAATPLSLSSDIAIHNIVANAITATGSIYSTGRVGIGTVTPGTDDDYSPMLHVKGTTASDGTHWSGRIIASGPANAVVMGEWNGVAQLAGNNALLYGWSDLAINSGGGRVGIGTTTPAQKLSVAGTVESTSGGFKFPDGSVQTSSAYPNASGLLRILGTASPSWPTTGEGIEMAYSTTNHKGWIQSYDRSTSSWRDLDINALSVNINAPVTAPSFTPTSSRRFKTNIQTIEGALEKVELLRGVSYVWRETGKQDIGVIAEEVGQVVPEVVVYEANGVDAKAVDYSHLTGLLIEAIKEQQNQIREFRAEIEAMKKL